MNVAVVGATGFVGWRVVNELVRRGHYVTAISRSVDRLPPRAQITPSATSIFDEPALAKLFKGQDAIIHAYAVGRGTPDRAGLVRRGTQAIIDAAKAAGVKRVIAVGGAGSLKVGDRMNMERPEFPQKWIESATVTKQIFHLLHAEPELEWTYLCPPHFLVPGERTGKFRVGDDEMLVGPDGESTISLEDFAVAMVDEIERPAHVRRRFTVGY
jgi:putative NADH-flavin reductase